MGKTTLLSHIANRALAIPPNIDCLLCEQGLYGKPEKENAGPTPGPGPRPGPEEDPKEDSKEDPEEDSREASKEDLYQDSGEDPYDRNLCDCVTFTSRVLTIHLTLTINYELFWAQIHVILSSGS